MCGNSTFSRHRGAGGTPCHGECRGARVSLLCKDLSDKNMKIKEFIKRRELIYKKNN
jgi:hypothetical protein